jgi:hypothetical protein
MEHQKEMAMNDRQVFHFYLKRYGITLLSFYFALGLVDVGLNKLRSLDEKYKIVKQFGLDRIW